MIEKTVTLGILLSLLTMLPLPTAETSGEQNSWRLRLTTDNDYFNTGFTMNLDDLRSFGVAALYEYDNWQFNLSGYGFTNRDLSGQRVDELALAAGYRFSVFEQLNHIPLSLTLLPTGNFLIAGNLGGEAAQNLLHTIIDFYELRLPYHPYRFSAGAGLTARLDYNFPPPAQLNLQIQWQLSAAFKSLLLYSSFASIFTGPVFRANGSRLEIAVGLKNGWDHSRYQTKIDSFAQMNGACVTYTEQIDFLYFKRRISIGGTFSDGSIGLVIAFDPQKESYKYSQRHFALDIGAHLMKDSAQAFLRHSFALPWQLPLSISISERFNTSAEWIRFSDIVKNWFSENEITLDMEYGLSFHLPIIGILNPYAAMGIGFYHLFIFNSADSDYPAQMIYPLTMFELGLRWHGLSLINPSNSHGMFVSLRCAVPLIEISADSVYHKIGSNVYRPALVIGYTINVDLADD